jgi:hypothetical protein
MYASSAPVSFSISIIHHRKAVLYRICNSPVSVNANLPYGFDTPYLPYLNFIAFAAGKILAS